MLRRLLILLITVVALHAADQAPIRVACIGDSITFGYGDEKGSNYPLRLQRALGDGWQVKNFGIPGSHLSATDTKAYVAQAAWASAKAFAPQVAVVMLGTNDALSPKLPTTAPTLTQDLVQMVTDLRSLESKPLVVICLPCFIGDPGNERKLENDVLPQITAAATQAEALLLDLHTASKQTGGQEPAAFFVDRLHPAAVGHKLIAETVQRALTEAQAAGTIPK